MRLQSITYRDDNKAETRLNFGENLAFVISAPVSVRIDGDVPEEEAEKLEALRQEFEAMITREIDFALFGICLAAIKAAGNGRRRRQDDDVPHA